MKLSVVLVPLLSVAYAMDLDQLTKRPGHKTKKGKLRQPAETSESSASHGRKKPKFVPLDLSMANEEKGPASSPKIEALLNTSAEQRYFWKRVLDDCEKIDTTKMRNVLRGDKLSPTDALFLTLHDGKERFTKGAAPQCLDKITNYLIKDRKADIVEALDLLTQTDEGSVDYLKLLLENGYVKNDSRGPKTLFSVITKFANIDGGKDLPAALELAFTYDDKKPTDEQVKTFLATDGKVLEDVIMILRDHGHDIPLPKEDGKLADAVLKAVIPEDTVKDGGKMATLEEEPEPVEAVDKAHIPVIVVEDEVPRKKDDGLEEGDDIPLPEADEMGIEEPFIPAKDEVVTEAKGEKIEKEEPVIPVVDETSEKGNKKPLKDDIVTEKEKVKMQESEPEMIIPTIAVIPPEVEIKEGTKKSRRRRTGEKTTEVSPAESTKDDDTLIPPMSEAVRQHSSLVDEFNMSVAELSDEEFAKLIQSIKDVKIAKELELSHPRIDGERMRCLQPTPSRNVDWFDRVPSMVMDGRTEGALFYTLESLQAGASVNEKPEGSKHGSPLEHVINDFNTRVGPLFGALLIRYGAKIEGVKTWTSLSGKKMQSAVQLARKLSTMEPGVIRRALLRLAEADSLYPMWHEYIKFSKNMIEAPSLEKAQEYAVAGLNATLALEIVLLDADSEDEGLDKIIKFWIDKGASICEAVHRVLMRKSRDSDRAKHFEYLVKPSDDRETGGPLESHLLQRQHVHYDDTTLFSSAILIAGENLKYHYDLAAYYEHPKGPSKGDLKELERLAARNEVAKTILESLRQNQSSSVADSQTEDSSTSSAITITPVDETSNASTITV